MLGGLKLSDVGARLTRGVGAATPFTVRVTFCGEGDALSMKWRLAVRAPRPPGVTVKSPGFDPVSVGVLTDSVTLPVLVTVTCVPADVCPTVTFPKLIVVGATVAPVCVPNP